MDKPSVFVTRRWPEIAEKELKKYFNVTFNHGDKALSNEELKDAFYNHDALAPTVSDTIDENIIKSGKSGKGKIISNYGVGFSHIDLDKADAIIHGQLPDGKVITGMDVTFLAWEIVNRNSWLRLLKLPLLRPITDWCYLFFAKHRRRITRLLCKSLTD